MASKRANLFSRVCTGRACTYDGSSNNTLNFSSSSAQNRRQRTKKKQTTQSKPVHNMVSVPSTTWICILNILFLGTRLCYVVIRITPFCKKKSDWQQTMIGPSPKLCLLFLQLFGRNSLVEGTVKSKIFLNGTRVQKGLITNINRYHVNIWLSNPVDRSRPCINNQEMLYIVWFKSQILKCNGRSTVKCNMSIHRVFIKNVPYWKTQTQ